MSHLVGRDGRVLPEFWQGFAGGFCGMAGFCRVELLCVCAIYVCMDALHWSLSSLQGCVGLNLESAWHP
jgi:hypothetical protein